LVLPSMNYYSYLHVKILLRFKIHRKTIVVKQTKAFPARGREGLYGCETSRLPHFLDSRATDDDEDVILSRRPPFSRRNIPGTQLC
jgi:hypothetical protein